MKNHYKPFPKKKFQIIYADPPWKYNARNNTKTKFGGGAMSHYPIMTNQELYDLPVDKLAADNCALFLWTTFPRLQVALKCMELWGFKYKTIGFNWIKVNKNNAPFFGIGYYTKSNSEICLLGVRGKMKPISNKVSQIVWPEIDVISSRQAHSKKPDLIRDKIVELFGAVPRIELFARQRKKGWSVWGLEV